MKKPGSILAAFAFLVLALLATTLVSGSDIVFSGLVQVGDTNDFEIYRVTTDRYTVVATSGNGDVVPLDQDMVEALCQDIDGCSVVLQVVGRFGGQPGNVDSYPAHLFLSETVDVDDNWWQLSVGVIGNDDSASVSQWDDAAIDPQCRFTDAETSGPDNQGSDNNLGFGLINLENAPTNSNSCRILIMD